MAKTIAASELATVIRKRIQERLKRFEPGDPRIRETMARIGVALETQIKLNIRQQRLIDTGRLLNSIRWEYLKRKDKTGIVAGSYGVPYAAIHEFGYNGPQTVSPHTRTITKAFGKPISPVTVQINGFTRYMRMPEKPYLRPAIKKQSRFIMGQLRELFRFNG